MTVAELMELLKQHDPAMRVVVAGYEGGFNDLSYVEPMMLTLNVHEEWFYGAHDVPEKGQEGLAVLRLGGVNPLAKDD
ncbi:MAG: hypothetical protein HQL82_15155 [Magnetococcales bacterium]|nr:hypothetical protein [Magnetococcales bacterium]